MPSQWLALAAGGDSRVRARQLRQSWERLLALRELKSESGPELAGGLRTPIVKSWRRSLDIGLDPVGWLAPIEADPAEIKERWWEHPLGSLARVLSDQLETIAEDLQSLIVVSDATGLLLHLQGSDRLKERAAADMNFLEGASWSETAAGTNAIGTALAEDHALQVFSFEHFNPREHGWTCSAAPVHDPMSRRVVGIVDLTGPWKTVHPASLPLVAGVARTMERCLADARRDLNARLRRRYGGLALRTADLLVSADGYVLAGDHLSAQEVPLTIPAGGGEIILGDGSRASVEPLGQGEAYLVRCIRQNGSAPTKSPQRAGEDIDEEAKGSLPTARVESGSPGAEPGRHAVSAYFEAALDCVIMADASGRVVDFNRAAERTFGYSRDEALGRTMAELIVPPSLRERHSAAFARFVETGHGTMLGRRLELTGMRADGSEFPVELALSRIEGEPFLICGALRDISAAKQAERHLRELAEEQAALRRVATLVARESSPQRLFALVAEQVARIIDVPLVRLVRYESDGSAAELIGVFGESVDPLALGTRWQLDGPGVLSSVWQSGQPARIDDYTDLRGEAAAVVRQAGMHSAVASPITVEGRLWGAIAALSPRREPLPADTEARLADFTELIATAISNTEARDGERRLAEEQAGLRRVAELVAREASQVEVFAAVADVVSGLLGEEVRMVRYEANDAVVVAGSAGPLEHVFPVGSRVPLGGNNAVSRVFRTGKPVRIDDYREASGPIADTVSPTGLRSVVSTPIVVEGRLWGTMVVAAFRDEPIPPQTESRLAQFTELVATALANAESRAGLAASEARARKLADEQAALRRVATLVARESLPEELFAVVAEEVGRVVNVPLVALARYEPDGSAIQLVGAWSEGALPVPIGGRWLLDGPSSFLSVWQTGKPARVGDSTDLPGEIAAARRQAGLSSSVASPIRVEGRLWGVISVASAEPLPEDTDMRLLDFTELVATAIANSESRTELAASEGHARNLAAEQAGLRRVATLVARESLPEELFAVVAEEVGQVLCVPIVVLVRYESDGSVMQVLGGWSERAFPVPMGTRLSLDGPSHFADVWATGRPARLDDPTDLPGEIAFAMREADVGSGAASPILVEGRIWGAIGVGLFGFSERLPDDIEARLADYTELVATAIANSESRTELAASEGHARKLAAEQAALRRVATLVARESLPEELFAVVAEEVGRIMNVPRVVLARYEADGSAMHIVSGWTESAVPPPIGRRFLLDYPSEFLSVWKTRRPARTDDLTDLPGEMAAAQRQAGLNSIVAGPILVEGRLWGAIGVGSAEALPEDTEVRLLDFTELVATAIANSAARDNLRRLAAEQAALGRVATLVAKGATGDALFAAVAREVAALFGVTMVSIDRYENGESIVLASLGVPEFPVGSRWPLDGPGVRALVYETRRPARVDDFSEVAGTAPANARAHDIQSAVGVPIVVDGKVWGILGIGSRRGQLLPRDVESQLAAFTELVSTAIANSDARDHVSRLLDEQSALRRVATLVAEGATAEELFSAVAQEVAGVIGIPVVGVHRYEPDATFTMVGAAGDTSFTVGSRWPVEDDGLAGMILASGRPARKDDYSTMPGPVGAAVRDDGMVSMVGVPIEVNGSIWGFMVAGGGPGEAIPTGVEEHLARFTELLATAVSNATMRDELAASRARVIAAADEARRRIERDLHDGAQQQLITLLLGLRSAEGRIPAGLEDMRAEVGRFADRLTSVVEELREMSRGIHPAILTEGGLSSALEALALRSSVPVKLNVRCDGRLRDEVEVAAYYVVSEALTNAAKHADASRVQIDLHVDEESLYLSVIDDGVGGAGLGGGSGLIGLKDRVEALGGMIDVTSPPGSGTRLDVEIPLLADPSVASRSGSPSPV